MGGFHVLPANATEFHEEKITKMILPHLLIVNRNPKKQIAYSRCLGLFRTEKDTFVVTGIKPVDDYFCPQPERIKMKVSNQSGVVQAQTDNGFTTSETVSMETEAFEEKVEIDDKLWQFAFFPQRITVTVSGTPGTNEAVTDKFCLAVAWQNEIKKRKLLACDDCTTIRTCLATKLTITETEFRNETNSTPHAGTKESSPRSETHKK